MNIVVPDMGSAEGKRRSSWTGAWLLLPALGLDVFVKAERKTRATLPELKQRNQ